MITIKNITKVYGKTTVLDVPFLDIKAGESVGLAGNNGAGKTTLFRCLLDLILPDTGTVTINDENVMGTEGWKKITGSYLDEGFLIDYLTPDEYFYFTGNLYGLSKDEIASRLSNYADFFHGEILGQKKYIRDLSKGNQKKVGIVAALLPRPSVLILDEPFANLDPTTQIRLKNLLRSEQKAHNLTTFISSHDLNHVVEVCNRIVVVEKGRVVSDNITTADTLNQLESYFNVEAEGSVMDAQKTLYDATTPIDASGGYNNTGAAYLHD